MEDKILKIIFVSVIIFVLGLVLVPRIVCEAWSISMGRPTALEITINNIKNEVDNTIHGNKYKEKIDKYMKEKFGEAVVEKLGVVKYPANYYCKFKEIMDNGFYVSYDKKYDVCSDNFSDIISTDSKFQHLYSEWVKKQIGIDDENVELKIGFSRSELDFRKINNLSNDYSEIFENCQYTLNRISIKNIGNNNKFKVFNDFRLKYYDKLKKDKNNTFEIWFDGETSGNSIGIQDYNIIGKKDYYLQNIGINKNRTIQIVGDYKQLDDIFRDADNIIELIESMIPKKNTVDINLSKIIKDKVYDRSVLRLDISDIINNRYVLDVKYNDLAAAPNGVSAAEYYYDYEDENGRRLIIDVPRYIRYDIFFNESILDIKNYKEIHHSEYIGDKGYADNNEYKKKVIVDTTIVDKKYKDKIKDGATEIEFYSLKLEGQIDEEKINEVVSKKFKEVTKKFIEANIESPRTINNKLKRKYLFDVASQMKDYIIFKSMILEEYLVLDLREYDFVENKVMGERYRVMLHKIGNKFFLIYNNEEFINYKVINQNDSMINIIYFNKYVNKFENVIVDLNKQIITDTNEIYKKKYSEWIKQKVGINNENVEFLFYGDFDTEINVCDVINNFDEYIEMFKYTYELKGCEVKNIGDLNENNKIEKAKYVKKEYLFKVTQIDNISYINIPGSIILSNKNIKYGFSYDDIESTNIWRWVDDLGKKEVY